MGILNGKVAAIELTIQHPIVPFTEADISRLPFIQPPEWGDVRRVFRKFLGKHWFYPFKIEVGTELVAVGEAIHHGRTAWIGNIIVAPEWQRKGYGKAITLYLMRLLEEKGAQTQLLLATEMGKGLYQQIGFEEETRNYFYQVTQAVHIDRNFQIEDIQRSDLPDLFALDEEVMGEKRAHLIEDFFPGGKLIREPEHGTLLAFFLPQLGEGLLLTRDHQAGMALSGYRLEQGAQVLVVPEQNKRIIEWVEAVGFPHFRTAYRMVYGKRIDWKPEGIYSRIGGYLG